MKRERGLPHFTELVLRPGDVLVLQSAESLTVEEAERMQAVVNSVPGLKGRVLVIDPTLKVVVARKGATSPEPGGSS